ncbi:MAG: NF038122 family metalloprotease [Phycisphaerales bacterium]
MPSRLPVTPLVVASSLALGSSAVAQLNPIANLIVQTQPDPVPRLVIPTGSQIVTLPGGTQQVMQTEQVWKPVCSNKASVSKLDLMAMAASHAADFADPTGAQIIDHAPAPRAGLNVVYVLGGSVPAGAAAAFATAEAYLESQFPADSMTLTVTVSFAALQPGVIGGTSSSYGSLSWSASRSTLVAGMDASDSIQSSLPAGSTIPVRYSTSSTTNETRIFWTFANFKASGGSVAGNDASMTYSTAFPFDFDPSNGVSANTISLVDVIIHETGHSMGFGSGVDFRNRDIETHDIFRFRVTDGNADFNPDSAAEFTVRPRWAVRNNPNDDVQFDTISGVEYRLSDGSPWQASHWREQVPAIGIMDPAFNYAETFYPTFLRASDLTAFDAIGWDK